MMHSISHLAYIDPGTGSMLFTVAIGVIAALSFALKNVFIKLRFKFLSGDAKIKENIKTPFVLFSEGERYKNVFVPVLDEFEKRGIDCEYWSASEKDSVLSNEYSHVKCLFIGEGNKAFAKLNMMNADICLATTPGLDVYQWKRSKSTSYYAHVFHSLDDGTIYRMFALDYYNAVLAPGAFVEKKMRMLEKMRETEAKEFVAVGSTYMDVLAKRLKSAPKHENSETTVLLAPSWGTSSILSKYGEKIVKALLSTGYNIVVRPHPQSKTAEPEILEALEKVFANEKKLSWNYDADNFEILNKCDILITDFSAVIFDFALIFDKPVIYADTSFDPSPYDAAWFEQQPWTFDVLPRIGKKLDESDFSEMKRIIDEMLSNDEYSQKRHELREEALANPGRSAEAIVDFLVEKQKEINLAKTEQSNENPYLDNNVKKTVRKGRTD